MNEKELKDLIEKEGKRKEFVYKGYNCLIRRTPVQILCGYVEIPKAHELYNADIDESDYEVHGGITYPGGDLEGNGKNYIGFDCAHYNDLIPHSHFEYPSYMRIETDIYRTMDYVEQEIKNLVDQLVTEVE